MPQLGFELNSDPLVLALATLLQLCVDSDSLFIAQLLWLFISCDRGIFDHNRALLSLITYVSKQLNLQLMAVKAVFLLRLNRSDKF